MSNAFLSGFLTSLALIVPIGAQNAFVLKLGLMRQHVLVIALLCGFMDAALILLGVTFAGATFGQYGWALLGVKYVGVAFLVVYGFRAFMTAYKHAQPMAETPLNQTISLKSRSRHGAGLHAAEPACLPRHRAADWRHQRAIQAEPVRLRRGCADCIIHLVFNPRLWRTAAAAAVCQSANLGGFRGGDWAFDVEHCLPYLVFAA